MDEEEEEEEEEEGGEEEEDDDDDEDNGWITNKYGSTDRKRGQSEEDLKIPNLNFDEVADVRGTLSNFAPQHHLGESATPDQPGEVEKDDGVSKSNDRSWRMFKGCVDSVPTLCYH